jgi:RNA polymerase sigma-70 factor (ECF subfamily)
MIRYQAGDASAVDELVSQLSPRLLRFLSHPQLDRADAEDLLQDCWLRIHRVRHTYRATEPLLPWVFAIAHHTRLDGFRRRQRRGRLEVLVPEVPERASDTGLNQHRPDVLGLLDELPDGPREVVRLLKIGEMSLEEVARATGSSLGAVKQKAHRAYATLRQILAKGA